MFGSYIPNIFEIIFVNNESNEDYCQKIFKYVFWILWFCILFFSINMPVLISNCISKTSFFTEKAGKFLWIINYNIYPRYNLVSYDIIWYLRFHNIVSDFFLGCVKYLLSYINVPMYIYSLYPHKHQRNYFSRWSFQTILALEIYYWSNITHWL